MPKYVKSNINLSNYSKEVIKKMDIEIATTGLEIETDAKRNVPVKTGRLKGSINSRVENDAMKIGAYVDYASFIEFGTTKQRAQPFLYPAFLKNTKDLESRLLKIALNETAK
jgi:HK97 gp10 family phage protein